MRPIWTADVVADEGLVRRLLSQFDELAGESLRPLAEGWDYSVWVVDERWAFRFPRREVVVPGTQLEIRVLPLLAPTLPVAVPAPVFVGTPTDDFPRPFVGSPLLPGRELAGLGLDDDARARAASELGTFLRVLHAADVADLPADSNRRAEMPTRVAITREQLTAVDELWSRPPVVDELLAEAERLPEPRIETVVHGDLHQRQLLAEPDGALTGVLDWVDVCRSDAAIDFPLYWSHFPPPAREAFLDAYGPVTDEQLLRARVLAFSLCAALAAYGRDTGNRAVLADALAGLQRAAAPA